MNDIDFSRFSGFADLYDDTRPRPPVVIPELLLSLLGRGKAGTVVDLGSGTGLSTLIWKYHAVRIIGIEPNDDMRNEAQARNGDPAVEYRPGHSYETGLASGSVDIVTCSQSFHWMEPSSTLAECGRILKANGLFAAFDNDWPPALEWRCDKAYTEMMTLVKETYKRNSGVLPREEHFPKERHLDNLKKSGLFAYCGEMVLHNTEECGAVRYINLLLSQGSVQALLKNGIKEIEKPLKQFTRDIRSFMGNIKKKMWVSYRVRVGIKGEEKI